MSDDGYAQRQQDRDRQYERQYREWVNSLSPEERTKLVEKGLDQPHLERCGAVGLDRDIADSPRASETPDIIESIEPSQTQSPEPGPGSEEWVLEAFRRMFGEIITQPNPQLNLECLALATGIAFMGDSETEIARRHGVTRSAVSKRCVELTERLGLPPSRAMRRLTARAAYARTQRRIRTSHERIDRRARKRGDQS